MHGSKRKGAAALAVLAIASLAVVASAFARADVAPTAAAAPECRVRRREDRLHGPDHR